MIIYFAFFLFIVCSLKKYMKIAIGFVEAGGSVPWLVTGLSFF
jgi:hypothetical protein